MIKNGKVDVIIPVHGQVHWLVLCLTELVRYFTNSIESVTIINDRSNEAESRKINELAQKYHNFNFKSNEALVGGFAFACNMAAKEAQSEYILFLNTDCLITKGSIQKLVHVLNKLPHVAMVCPLSNNSPVLTYPIWPGYNYKTMATLINKAVPDDLKKSVMEACTIVGNCLLVRRSVFEDVDGFDPVWGLGYGEETELQMKAMKKGFIGAVHIGTYVYHYSGATFNRLEGADLIRKKNHSLFKKKWAKQYNMLVARTKNKNPIKRLNYYLDICIKSGMNSSIKNEVLFYIEGIKQDVGGLHVPLSICNNLILEEFSANCVLISPPHTHRETFVAYEEVLFFEPLVFSGFSEIQGIEAKLLFSTLCVSTQTAVDIAKKIGAHSIQFIQGYECYFEHGKFFSKVKKAFKLTKRIVTTSHFLKKMISRHLDANQNISILPMPINKYIFFPSGLLKKKFDICFVLRQSLDKGQWLIRELIDRFLCYDLHLLLLLGKEYEIEENYRNITIVNMPISQFQIAAYLRQTKVFVDCSLHEGFGLLPLEAGLSGCRLVLSDSGGITSYAHLFDSIVQPIRADIKNFQSAIEKQVFKKDLTLQECLHQSAAYPNFSIDQWLTYIDNFSFLPKSASQLHQANNKRSLVKINTSNHGKKLKKRMGAIFQQVFYFFNKKFGKYLPVRLKRAMKIIIFGE